MQTIKRLPSWLHRTLPTRSAGNTHEILSRYKLNTVCESALCPNRSECYAQNTATFMILGNTCTRSCGFCAIDVGKAETVSEDEPQRVAKAAKELGLTYIVITSVARDDLADEGAGHFARTLEAIREYIPMAEMEVLTPDFHARKELLEIVVEKKPNVYNHNLESVRRLQKKIRPQADYERSLRVLQLVKEIDPTIITKSGLMLGLGETLEEVYVTARDLRSVDCDILTLGQYLRPSPQHLEIEKFIEPEIFDKLAVDFKRLGFKEVFAGPYVRSSYHAGETYMATNGAEEHYG